MIPNQLHYNISGSLLSQDKLGLNHACHNILSSINLNYSDLIFLLPYNIDLAIDLNKNFCITICAS